MNKIIELRHTLHQNAELSLKEDKTRELIKAFISDNTALTPVERDGCVYAVYDIGADKTVALRADIDALPIEECGAEREYSSLDNSVSHRCGHDGHTAALCGAMLKILQDGSSCNVVFIFQPAEEIGLGGERAVSILRELNVTEAYGWHNIPAFKRGAVLIRRNTFCCGSCGITIELIGKSAHAAYPEYGVSPVKAVCDILGYVEQLNAIPSGGHLHCTVVGVDCGGEDFGVAAYHARVMLTLRGEIAGEYDAAKRTLADYVQHRAKKYELACEISYCDIFPPTQNNADCVKHLTAVCEASKVDIVKPSQPFRWSEDFGFYTQSIKGCFFGIGDGEDYPALHTQDYDFPDDILEVAVAVLANIVK